LLILVFKYGTLTFDLGGVRLQIPNILTVIRLMLVPALGYLMIIKDYKNAMALFLVIGVTDVLDGYVARKYHMVSKLGTLLDPIADKLVQGTAIGVLTYNGLVPVVVIVVVVIKEALLGLGAVTLYKKGQVVVQANWYGKLATVFFYAAILFTIGLNIIDYQIRYVYYIVNGLFAVAVLATLYALYMYTKNYMKVKNRI
jgi:cardiolipin synthase (CMP-forming)